jgi:hypothetical protein
VPERRVPDGVVYATVHEHPVKGRVVAVEPRLVFGTEDESDEALGESGSGSTVNTWFVERQNATDRHRDARKGRRTYRFSKDWQVHEAMTYLTLDSDNFCWCVRTLRVRDEEGGARSGRRRWPPA